MLVISLEYVYYKFDLDLSLIKENAMSVIQKATDSINPIGTDGFEFVEYSAPTEAGIEELKSFFVSLGFTEVLRHKTKKVTVFQQGDIRFVVNGDSGHVKTLAEHHGPCASAIGFRVADAKHALQYALKQGATAFQQDDNYLKVPAILGIGNTVLYFIDQYAEKEGVEVPWFSAGDFITIQEAEAGAGLLVLDHLTHNVKRGNMDHWAGFYERIANFKEIRYFDIEGKLTGLVSKAMTAPCGKIRIPINESSDEKSQIEEFLDTYNGEGIQHIALSTDNIYKTVELLKSRGVEFLDTPDTYYDKTDARVPGHQESVEELRKLRILIDGAPTDDQGILLQIFTQTAIGPIFFEIIQRKGNQGFGEGNFKALFESIEEDQVRRGVLNDA